MEIRGIVLGVLVITFLAILVYWDIRADKNTFHAPVLFIMYLFTISLAGMVFEEKGIKEGAIETLKNKSPYKMEIRYELKDSTYVPIDTIFTKK